MAKARKKTQSDQSPVATAPQSVGDTTAATTDRSRIAQRAYELYLERGGRDGAAMDDWLTAERELGQDSGSTREP